MIRTALCVLLLSLPGLVMAAGQSEAPAAPIQGLKFLGRYEAGGPTAAEIVAWNPANQTAYVINGRDRTVDLVPLGGLAEGRLSATLKLNLADAASRAGVEFGDVTSVAVAPDGSLVALAIQAADYTKNGCVVFLTPAGDVVAALEAGVQPDMLCFTPDGKMVLVANEGEPRGGTLAVDPPGSVSLFAIEGGVPRLTKTLGFEGLDGAELRKAGVLVQTKRDAQGRVESVLDPALDLEPEYIAVGAGGSAWVSLQEANAVAKINLKTSRLEWVRPLPTKDYSLAGNELDVREDKKAELWSEPLAGLLMPDAIASYTVGGRTYLVTANEGDGREWPLLANGEADEANAGFYKNEVKASKVKASQVAPTLPQAQKDFLALAREKDSVLASVVLHAEKSRNDEGLYDRLYVFGGRSFSILDAETLELVFDSGSQFEQLAAQRFPKAFNASNDNVKVDSRSPKKGPEPEGVEVARVGSRFYAFVGLERQSGVAVFDVTNPRAPGFVAYETSRDFSAAVAGDSGPEGLEWVPGSTSPTGKGLVLVANETSGTLAVFEVQ